MKKIIKITKTEDKKMTRNAKIAYKQGCRCFRLLSFSAEWLDPWEIAGDVTAFGVGLLLFPWLIDIRTGSRAGCGHVRKTISVRSGISYENSGFLLLVALCYGICGDTWYWSYNIFVGIRMRSSTVIVGDRCCMGSRTCSVCLRSMPE